MAQMNSFQGSDGSVIIIDLPEVANVFTNDTVLATPGTGTQPAAADLRSGVQCGIGGTGVTGTLVIVGTVGGHIARR